MFDELSTASNIKLKATKLAAIEALKHIQVYLKTLKNIPENGIALFSGNCLKTIVPPNRIKQFIYKCDKKFHVTSLYDLYEEHDNYGIILVSGSETSFYILNHGHKLIYKMNVSLQSRQKKGGQSAVRIARLAEEKRFIYVKSIVEKLNALFIDVKGIIIAGPAEMKNAIDCDLIHYKLRPLIMHKITMDITSESIYTIIDMDLIGKNVLNHEEALCKHIVESIQCDPKYIYGMEEIHHYLEMNNCECIYVHETMDHNFKEAIVVKSNDKYGKLFQQYGGIVLVCYYPMI